MSNRPQGPSSGHDGRNILHPHHRGRPRTNPPHNNANNGSMHNGNASYASSPSQNRRRPYQGRGGGGFGGGGGDTRMCYNCGVAGHLARDCLEPPTRNNNNNNNNSGVAGGPPPPPPPPRDHRRGQPRSSSFHSYDQSNNNAPYQKSPHGGNIMQTTTPPNFSKGQHQQQAQQLTPIPEEHRRTLIFANVPEHVHFKDLMKFFRRNWNSQIQFAYVDRIAGEAYVKFTSPQDARRVWEEGQGQGLDGDTFNGADGPDSNEGEVLSLVKEGVTLKAVHICNAIVTDPEEGTEVRVNSQGRQGFDRKRSWGDQRDAAPGGGGGGGRDRSYSQQMNKAPRYNRDGHDGNVHSHDHNSLNAGNYDYDHQYNQYNDSTPQQPPPPPPPHEAKSPQYQKPPPPQQLQHPPYSSNNPKPQPLHRNKLSPLQIQALQQRDEEQQLQWQKFQKEEEEWRSRRNAEYQSFLEAQTQRASQITKSEQKRELLVKQEGMLDKQLTLHKKMLTMLKSKDAPKSDQTTKMKEILNTQTKITALKKEMKELVEDLEKKKDEDRKCVFVPSEKRPMFQGSGGGLGKRSLDRRTKVLRVEGFEIVDYQAEGGDVDENGESKGNPTESALKEHFAAICTVVSVALKFSNDEDSRPYALINFGTRIDAERAKSSDAKFNEATLTYKWHNPKSPTTNGNEPSDDLDASGVDYGAGLDDNYADDHLYDDVGYDDGGYAGVEGGEQIQHECDEDENMVDYDYDEEVYDD